MELRVVSSVVLILTILKPDCLEGYRILGVFPLHMQSHFTMLEALMKGLARKGHQVDVISSFPQRKPYPNYTDIIVLPSTLTPLVDNVTYESINANSSPVSILSIMGEMFGNKLCKAIEHPQLVKLIKNPPRDPPYDLLIIEVHCAHCFMALSHHLRVPMIGVCTAALYPWHNGIIANPANLAFVPNNLISYTTPLRFWQRLSNTVYATFATLHFQYVTRAQNEIIKKHFGEDAPGVRELERNVSLLLTNTHPTLRGSAPITAGIIEVAGLHIQDDGPELAQDLVQWMDESTDGFVLFTFGSMVKIESFPEKILRNLYKSLEKITPIRVLVRITEPNKLPSGVPKNFRTFVWTTQYKVLKHKNLKAFITHGGLMGTLEAINCAVPMIGIPMFVDQFTNMDLYTGMKIAVKVDHKNITEENMNEALNKILYDPAYKNAMLNISAKFRDRPMSPVDTATWWVEYVLKHGRDSLRSPAMDLTWWQIELLDVYAFILLTAAFSVFIMIAVIRFLIYKLFFTRNLEVIHSKKVQ